VCVCVRVCERGEGGGEDKESKGDVLGSPRRNERSTNPMPNGIKVDKTRVDECRLL